MRLPRTLYAALALSLAVHLALLIDSSRLPAVAEQTQPLALRPLKARLSGHKLADAAAPDAAAPAKPLSAPPAGTTVQIAATPTIAKPHHRKPKRIRAKPIELSVARDSSSTTASAPLRDASSALATAPDNGSRMPASGATGASAAVAASTAIVASAPAQTPPPVATSAATAPGMQIASGAAENAGFPHHIKLRYNLSYNGIPANGVTEWSFKNGRYRLELNLSALFASVRYESSGSAGPNGLRPEQYQAWRGSDAREHASFDWNTNSLGYGDGEQKQSTLEAGAQDLLSLPWQLAIHGADQMQNLQVTNGKKVYHYPIRMAGQGNYPGAQELPVVVFRAESADNKTEFWLAPGRYFNVPVRIVFQDSDKTIRLDAKEIQIEGKTVWPLP